MDKKILHTIETERLRVTYTESGGGRPLLLITGYGQTAEEWPPEMIRSLSGEFRVICMNNRGVCGTGGGDGSYTVPGCADDAAALMSGLDQGPWYVAGYSMGGMIAQELALRHPGRVGRLALISATCGGAQATPASPKTIALMNAPAESALEMLENTGRYLFPGAWRAAHPDPFSWFPPVTCIPPPEIYTAQQEAIVTWEGTWGRLPGIRIPLLILQGPKDIITPPDNARIISGRVEGSVIIEIKGCGHGICYQEPEKCATILTGFFEEGEEK
ncbi:alpha/beta hydrolase [Methanogenium marinum]|uniref:Alpha/beta hydrolase n=1 Tax=Methanogenium marinum TaxID=348610 RepID=A0A9Q4KUI5_9EURY|nr:alpha/beta fold hydrolase [Methanogenium marinum]MDE4908332.1 alpha/beta hydrolase [Methanogenium marinum]